MPEYDLRILLDRIRSFLNETSMEMPLEARCLDLGSEVGELYKEWLISTDYAKTRFHATEKWEEEFGDVVFSLFCIALDTNTDISSALTRVLAKYRRRFDQTASIGSRTAD